jgi:hypothetical protein
VAHETNEETLRQFAAMLDEKSGVPLLIQYLEKHYGKMDQAFIDAYTGQNFPTLIDSEAEVLAEGDPKKMERLLKAKPELKAIDDWLCQYALETE